MTIQFFRGFNYFRIKQFTEFKKPKNKLNSSRNGTQKRDATGPIPIRFGTFKQF